MADTNEKRLAAIKSLEYIEDNCILGVGTGSTVNFLISELHQVRHKIKSIAASSEASTQLLLDEGFMVEDLSSTGSPDLYIDGADEITKNFHMIKGGGGALTREKVIAHASKEFVCIVDNSKIVDVLGRFPLPIEVIPMAKSMVSREIAKLGGQSELRHDFQTDNGNLILDVHNLTIIDPPSLEKEINNIPGVITNGIFALRPANAIIIGNAETTEVINNT